VLPLDNYEYEWLPHLKQSIPIEARHNRTSLYTIALEGWRRGLKLSFHNVYDENNKILLKYSLKSDKRVHYFDESSGDKNTNEAFKICGDKSLTNKYLKKANVPIPNDKKFDIDTSIEEIITHVQELNFPLVVKPTDESSGRGVITNIKNQQELEESLTILRKQYNYKNIIIQEHVHGDEIRIYVLKDKVIAATNRLPANVIGDGKHTIAQLIDFKNEARKNVPHLHFRPIIVDRTLRRIVEEQGFTLESVLSKGKRLFVREISNISTGGDPIDVTDQLTNEQKQIAIDATKAIPGLTHCGVDMIIPKNSNGGVIIEVNTRPGIGSHLFPIRGKARDIPKAVIDYYFPETKNNKRNDNVYFDLQAVFDSVNDGYAMEVELQPCPQNQMHTFKWIVTSKLDVMNVYYYLRKLLIKNKCHGHFKSIAENKIEIVLCHENPDTINDVKTYIKNRTSQLQIEQLTEEDYDKPIKLGFRVFNGLNQMSQAELERQCYENKKQVRQHELSVQRLNRRIKLMEKSSSWRITKPLRAVMDIIKR